MIRAIAAVVEHPAFVRLSSWMVRVPLVGGFWDGLASNPKKIERFVKFAIVGSIGAIVDFIVLNIMKLVFESIGLGETWNVSVSARQIQLAAANTVSFSAAVLSNFTWNRLWTFPESRERPPGPAIAAIYHCEHNWFGNKHPDLGGPGSVCAPAHSSRTVELQHRQGRCHRRCLVLEFRDELDLDLSRYRVMTRQRAANYHAHRD